MHPKVDKRAGPLSLLHIGNYYYYFLKFKLIYIAP